MVVALKKNATLNWKVEFAFGFTMDDAPGTWTFTDVTKYVRGQVSYQGGSQSNASTVDPSQISFRLNNTDGRFTARNVLSPYWPNVKVKTPVRVSVGWDGQAPQERITGFVTGWPLQPNAGVIDVEVPLAAAGRLRWLARTAKVLYSPMRGSLPRYNKVLSYWPLENGDLQSPIPGVADASVSGNPAVWSAVTGFPGSDTLPTCDGSTGFHATISGTFSTITDSTVDLFVNMPNVPTIPVLVERITYNASTSAFSHLDVMVSSTQFTLTSYDFDGILLQTLTVPNPSDFFGTWYRVRVEASDILVSPLMTLYLIPVSTGGPTIFNSSGSFGAPGVPRVITFSGTVNLVGMQFGQVIVYDGIGNTAFDNAANGWSGELGTDRAQRLCDESDIPITITATTFDDVMVGAQNIDTLYNNLTAIQDVTNGLLYDTGPLGNLVYTPGSARYNAQQLMAFDYTQRQIGDGLQATYDDQDRVNAWQISRTGGGSAKFVDPAATDSDLFMQSANVTAVDDDQCLDIAALRTHVSTFDAYRIPTIGIDIRNRSPEYATAIANPTSVFTLTYPAQVGIFRIPLPYPQNTFIGTNVPGLAQFIEGFSGVGDSVTWQETFNCRPSDPWQVAIVDAGDTGVVASGNLVGDTVITTTETTTSTDITVTPGVAGEWTTASSDYPFDLNLGGWEQVTAYDGRNGTSVIAQDGTFEQPTARASTWTVAGGTFVDATDHVNSGAHSGKLVVSGSPAQATARMPSASGIVVADLYSASVWVFATGTVANMGMAIDWFTSGNVFISSSTAAPITLGATTWTRLFINAATAPATAAKAQIGPTIGGTPANGTTIWVDDASLTHNTGATGSTVTFTVQRSINGVAKAWSSGSSVDPWVPAIVAL